MSAGLLEVKSDALASNERAPSSRRILALVLPELMVELALRKRSPAGNSASVPVPLGVVLQSNSGKRTPEQLSLLAGGQALIAPPELPATTPLSAVSAEAARFGVRAGQSIAEASALLSQLVVSELASAELETALASVAELALGFGITVAVSAPDTVWVDITGAAHLFGGEEELGRDLAERVRELGHRVRVAVSVGPELSRAFARWSPQTVRGERGLWVVPSTRTREAVAELPVNALPLQAEQQSYLMRLGLLTFGDLARQPRAALAARLGKEAGRVLELCAGEDAAPLVPYQPARTVVEQSSWEEPVTGSEPLGFVLRGLSARISARLRARGEAAEALVVTLQYDRTIAQFRGKATSVVLEFKLARPIYREPELRRIIASRLERQKLDAPTLGMKIEVPRLAPIVSRQLSLSELFSGDTSQAAEELPVVLAELMADIGEQQVGVLSLVDAHRPEARSSLRSALPEQAAGGRRRKARRSQAEPNATVRSGSARKTESPIWSKLPNPPTRLLAEPHELSAVLSLGSTLVLGHTVFTIERLRFEQRLEAVEWWSRPVARDYLRLWLTSDAGGVEALVYVDRPSGRRFLQAVGD